MPRLWNNNQGKVAIRGDRDRVAQDNLVVDILIDHNRAKIREPLTICRFEVRSRVYL